jgi:hypothetical protein
MRPISPFSSSMFAANAATPAGHPLPETIFFAPAGQERSQRSIGDDHAWILGTGA